MAASFDLQGHRGARGLAPENTLPSFERALDLGVTTVETDLHLTRDGVVVLSHDPALSERLCQLLPGSGAPNPSRHPLLSSLTLAQLRGYRADRNPDPQRFPDQEARVTPAARLFAERRAMDPYTLPTLAELFAFATAYAGNLGQQAGKTDAQRAAARAVQFDLELKRVPFQPELIGDTFAGVTAGLLEQQVVEAVRQAGVTGRTVVRSFDHRSVRAMRPLLPALRTAVLVAGTTPIHPAQLVRDADATIYCPEFTFLDEAQVRQLHAAGVRVVPWTVNEPADLERLLDWGADGVTTDFPDRLGSVLCARGIGL